MCRHPWVVCVLAFLAGTLAASRAAAQQEDGHLRLMQEPTSYTDVIDAFDKNDPFDLNVRAGYRYRNSWGTIQRETVVPSPGSTGSATSYPVAVADFRHTQHILDLHLDVGLYKDVALFVDLPVILADDRRLDYASGYNQNDINAVLAEPMGGPVFSLPFRSPTRSGLDHIAVGLAWAITNQFRDPQMPTWLIMAQGNFNLGKVLHACNANEPYSTAYDPTTDNFPDGTSFSGKCNGSNDAGMSDGTSGIQAETRASRRIGVAEPYAGLMFRMDWPVKAGSLYKPSGDLQGFLDTLPPIQGQITFGVAFIPWERKDRFQRLTIDLRGSARYISQGLEYTPLFDALGTSPSPYLRQPNYEAIPDTGQFVPGAGNNRPVHFSGLTTTQSHGRYGGRVMVDIRAAQYVEFVLGAGLFYTTPHFITFTDACNPNGNPTDTIGSGRTGQCSAGIIDPRHRPIIDLPGDRFQQNGSWTLDFQASAMARF